ncbi:MAG: potassium-transporting ATPase subunit F [Deltaproteobacteria bacterium]|nr:potassium-transporting ATPase subunit F [Deltaproteobacteria bacterium]
MSDSGFSSVSPTESRRIPTMEILGAFVSIALAIYLALALLRPEMFS